MSATPTTCSQYAEGYTAARGFYESRTFLAAQAAEAWTAATAGHPKGERTREALCILHPYLVRALDALAGNEGRGRDL